MPKIKVEIEVDVPNGEYCEDCDYCGIGGNGVTSYCYLFNKKLKIERLAEDWGNTCVRRCDECKQAEVKDGNK